MFFRLYGFDLNGQKHLRVGQDANSLRNYTHGMIARCGRQKFRVRLYMWDSQELRWKIRKLTEALK